MNRPVLCCAGLIAVFSCTQASSESVTRSPVSGIRPLLIHAIEQGTAHGLLTGPSARYVRDRFSATTPIEIDVRALHELPQAGCRRLEVTTRQRDVLQNGRRSDPVLYYQLNYCRDGRFPEQR